MKANAEKDEKTCWACKRTLVGESKFGLCPVCFNKSGSTGVIGILSLGAWGLRNRKKVLKSAIDTIKLIKF